MNPFVNALLRISGLAPLVGPMPLTIRQYDKLFASTPAFVDYFPVIDFDDENHVFIFDDQLNVGMAWELTARDLDAKPEDTLEQFNQLLAKALTDLPIDEEIPYTVQLFLQNAETDNLGTQMQNALPEHLKKEAFSQAVIELMTEHSDMLTHEHGLYRDKRVGTGKGWRVSSQRIFMLIYRKAPESYWKKHRKTPAQKLVDDTRSIIMALNGLKIQTQLMDDYDLIRWLAPIFSAGAFDAKQFSRQRCHNARELASYDIGQRCFQVAPVYHDSGTHSVDDFERGIFKFGDQYLRFLTTDGLQEIPENGCLTIAQEEDAASAWEQFPPGSMMTWTIVPEAQQKADAALEELEMKTQNAQSEHVQFTKKQIQEAKRQRLENREFIFYTQIGVYLSANSVTELNDKTYMAMDVIKGTRVLSFIRPEHDLLSPDSFKSALPFVYDFEHDRKNSNRARMTYLSQLAAILPVYGVGKGSNNPCYVMYKRSGEPFMYNPYLKSDRVRVAHQVVFGPTGAGKSATMINLALMSIAVNNPRMFILDKGNSFGLLADYAESLGKKVRRYTFNANSKDTFPPFFETEKALEENNDKLTDVSGPEDDEKRSYIAEMLNSLKIMVTGGNAKNVDAMEQADINFLQKSLIAALESAVAKGAKHAIISDVHEQMMKLSTEELLEPLQLRFRTMADALELWTQGLRGKLFNQIGEGFDENADLTLIETGALANEGSEDMFAVAGLAAMTNITALGERCQYEKRHIEVFMDEGHYWMTLLILIKGIIQATKVWRKLGIWLTLATQDFSDFPIEAKKILTQAEFWLLLSMEEEEAQQISRFKDLTAEEHHLIRQAIIEKPNYSEATLISKRFGCGLNRFIPPSLVLALAQTDKDEKAERQELMQKHDCTELEAAFMVADNIQAFRRTWQESHDMEQEYV